MADVARRVGVSLQTVSRVLHDSPLVRRETRERVLDAMRQLNYRPSPAAQALVTGRSRLLGVVSFDTALFGPASTLLGIEQAAHEAGYAVTIASFHTLNRASLMAAIHRHRDQGVDGIVVIAPVKSTIAALRQLAPDVPVVAVGGGLDRNISAVGVDQRGGAAAATRHLLELGHRTVWHIAGPSEWLDAEQRVAGWRSTLTSAGVQVPPVLRGDWSAGSGYELAHDLLRRRDVTAVFAGNDQMALGLLRRIHEVGRDAPAQISVVGFDDIPEAAYFTPPLTTVRQDFAEVGRRCLRLLLAKIESDREAASHIVVPSELVLRASTTAARHDARRSRSSRAQDRRQ
ncbi:MAG: LacI family DNA-binding transcriptional regulator [Kofleriaceae bacterium]